MTAVAIPHALIVGLELRPWLGDMGFRKPILFFVSTGLTVWSLGYLRMLLMPSQGWRCKWNRSIDLLLGVALSVEVSLIAVQAWRGRKSHFNHSTLIDRNIEVVMTFCIAIATAIVVYDTFRSFRRLATSCANAWALRAGMLFLTVSCALGFGISIYGWRLMSHGVSPSIVLPRGVLKFPHGAAIHALQLLPAIAGISGWIQSRLGVQAVVAAITGQALFLGYSMRQTWLGHDRWEFDGLGVFLMGLVAGSYGFSAIAISAGRYSRISHSA